MKMYVLANIADAFHLKAFNRSDYYYRMMKYMTLKIYIPP